MKGTRRIVRSVFPPPPSCLDARPRPAPPQLIIDSESVLALSTNQRPSFPGVPPSIGPPRPHSSGAAPPFSPPIDLQERFLFSCDIERGGGSARARPSFGIEGAMDHESDRLNQKHGKSWGEHGRRRVPLLVLRPDDSIYRSKRRTDDGRRSQALCVVRWLTNWKARSGGSCLFKARITTAWECGVKRKGGMWGRMDKMGFVLFLSLPLPPIPPQLEKPDTRRVYQHVALSSKSSSPPPKIETLFTVTEQVTKCPR